MWPPVRSKWPFVNVWLAAAKEFAASVRGGGEVPVGYQSSHFASPLSEGWEAPVG